MKEVTGIIDHRILLNFRVDPEVMQRNLPPEFTPKLVKGYAIGGICQVSLSAMRPKGMPAFVGGKSHNAAHRIAVQSSQGEGVFVTRRDTDSRLNAMAGGRMFPGVYAKADFDVAVSGEHYSVNISNAEQKLMAISGEVSETIREDSVFDSTEEVSTFFQGGNIGWSARPTGSEYDAIELVTQNWRMDPMTVEGPFSAFFSDPENFPPGSVSFDSAMIMRGIRHSWVYRDQLCDVCG